MKKWLILGYILALHLLLLALIIRPQLLEDQRWRIGLPEAEPTAFAREMHAMYRTIDQQAAARSLIIAGDSHVQRMPGDLLPAKHLALGIGGDTVRHLGKRLPDYQSLTTARLIILWAGYNDLRRRPVEEVAEDMKQLLQGLAADRLLLVGVPPVSSAAPHGIGNDDIAELNAAYAKLCEAPCRFIDPRSLLTDEGGSLRPAYDSGDGIHLNRQGYEQIAAAVRSMDKAAPFSSAN